MHNNPTTSQTTQGQSQTPPQDTGAAEDGRMTTRRRVLAWITGVSFAAFGAAFALPALALRTLTQEAKTVTSGDVLVYASGNQEGTPLEASSIATGTGVQAFPQGKTEDASNLIEVVRISDEPAGVVAYSAICTHLGCSVLANLTEEGLIACPCHGSFFDPDEDAAVRGGPAGRPLPSLPIQVNDDGSIIAAGTFEGEVGPA